MTADINLVFDQPGTFAAMYAAERCLRIAGFSAGSWQRGSPAGILFGDYSIPKWRNLRQHEIAELDGTMAGDGREGPITVSIKAGRALKFPEAMAALVAAHADCSASVPA